jgi:D-alanyl-lipoteichoic acid acyltransferase DltB (MBOAT superfamily)
MFDPVTLTTAIFIAILFMDLFTYNYKNLPIHALFGLFCIMVVSALVQSNMHGTAWLLVASPFLIIIGSSMIRDYRRRIDYEKTYHPEDPIQKFNPTPYYL